MQVRSEYDVGNPIVFLARFIMKWPHSAQSGSSSFGLAWVGFAAALAVHVYDEATHGFLSVYNPTVQAMRARIRHLPLPTFTFVTWITGLSVGIALLLCLSPLAFRETRWLRRVALPLGILVGIFNATLHLVSSAYYHRWMPGVFSSPLLLTAAVFLLVSSRTDPLRSQASTASTAPS